MNSIIIVVIAFVLFFWAYRFYAKKLENLWQIDPARSTPAFSKYDSVDFIPAKNWLVLFGHHFSSIAGAGPIIGPVFAVMVWGWVPALVWVIVGTVFIGGVHDFGALITSVREGGSSITDIASSVISKRAKVIFSLFVWLALILVIAVFTYLCAETFVSESKIVLPSLGLIPVALLIGALLYNFKTNSVLTTILGLLMLVGLIFLGEILPVRLGTNALLVWSIVLLLYCYVASILPVNLLLQPRDYLSSFLLYFGVIVGFLGICIQRPSFKTPAFIKFNPAEGLLWPMMCVTVACGAISGFHALIASGTTSKQLANERHTKRVGYGGMIAEGLVGVLAIICISCGLPGTDLAVKSGPIAIFGKGYGNVTKSILAGYGGFIAITILNAFILTTLDTATRITRYLSEEIFRIRNRYVSTLVVIIAAAFLTFSKDKYHSPIWKKIWPAFGASNQLVAALALFVLSCWLLARNKPAKITLIPAFFMLITTVSALLFQSAAYFKNKDGVLFIITLALIVLSGFMVFEVFTALSGQKKKKWLRN